MPNITATTKRKTKTATTVDVKIKWLSFKDLRYNYTTESQSLKNICGHI